jgi:ATP synthase protein I
MSLPPESREEAIARLTKSASDLEARTAPPLSHEAAGQAAAGQAWKIIADLFGGVFVGLAIGASGWIISPGPPGGYYRRRPSGLRLSVWMAWRTAQRLMAEAKQEWGAAVGSLRRRRRRSLRTDGRSATPVQDPEDRRSS